MGLTIIKYAAIDIGSNAVRMLISDILEMEGYATQFRKNALVRVPIHKAGKPSSTRIEYRALDSAANPYLAYSVLLAAGLRGIDQEYELPPEADEDMWTLSRTDARKAGLESLPQDLHEALRRMEESELVHSALGEHIFEWFLRNKRAEWADYQRRVTPFEIDRYLPVW